MHAMSAMACTSHPLATAVAIDVLKADGNALDAAIAACAMQCVVEPAATGIGGDCFAMYAPAGKAQPIAYNGSGRAPAAASVQALAALGVSKIDRGSPHAVVVPGAIDAWTQLHQDHGRMPFAELLQPAIDAARRGFPIASRVYFDLARQRDYLRDFDTTARIYLKDGEVPAVGSVQKLPELADSLAQLAQEGRDCFYRGDLAQDIVQELQSRGGLHTLADFANARGEYVTPITTEFRGRTIHECPPNGQGMIALLLLNIMRELPVDAGGPLTVDRIHLEIEACRQAYRTRDEWLADPAQADVPVQEILSDNYARALRQAIDPAQASEVTSAWPLPEHQDTVYISIVDKDRNACSFINTLFWAFGSGITTPRGIVLTNRGTGFSMDPASHNCIAANRRPLHTIIPAMTSRDGHIDLCFGVMGGEYQAMGHLQFLTRLFDFGCDIQQAMDLPRFMADPFTGVVAVESGIDDASCEALTARGHRITRAPVPIGGSQAISIDWQSGVLTGGSDPRKDGCAIGY